MTDKQKIEMLEKNQQKLINALVKKNKEYKKLEDDYKLMFHKFMFCSMILTKEQDNAVGIMAEAVYRKGDD